MIFLIFSRTLRRSDQLHAGQVGALGQLALHYPKFFADMRLMDLDMAAVFRESAGIAAGLFEASTAFGKQPQSLGRLIVGRGGAYLATPVDTR